MKRLGTVGRHPIVEAWNNTCLFADLIEILDSRLSGWNCMDVLRIGYEEETLPVIL
jgi:hypothetical protein